MSIKVKHIILLLAIPVFLLRLNATIINVPEDYTNIQTAIDSAMAGDTILVAKGEYGDITITKSLTIIGSGISGENATKLNSYSSCILVINTSGVVIKNILARGYIDYPAVTVYKAHDVSFENVYFIGGGASSSHLGFGFQGMWGLKLNNSNNIRLNKVIICGGKGGTVYGQHSIPIGVGKGGEGLLIDSTSSIVIDSSEIIGGYSEGYSLNIKNYSSVSVSNCILGNSYMVDSTSSLNEENISIVSISQNKIKSYSYSLSQNYPNPFNPTTMISYELSMNSFVSLKVYDILGREMTTLVNEDKPAGNYEVKFDASNFASGIYLYRIQAGSFTETKKMVLMR